MGLCTRRRIHVTFLVITILQILTTGLRQVSDFFGPLWALILANFFNIVFCILGFFGGYTRRIYFVIPYIVWSILWTGWNIFIFCLYIPSLKLDKYKSSVLSVGTGGFSWWEKGAPGCIGDWASESQLIVTNCYFDPNIIEGLQASVQIYLAVWGIATAISILCCPYYGHDNEKGDSRSMKSISDSYYTSSRTVPAFMSLTRNSRGNGGHSSLGSHGRKSSLRRIAQRGPLGIPKSTSGETNHVTSNGDILNHTTAVDDKLRPMTPRKVKRRSARSIQSSRFGPGPGVGSSSGQSSHGGGDSGPSTSRAHFSGNNGGSASGGSSNRNSLRSNHSSRRSTNRNSKRKSINSHPQFVSPINRLMQQQLDSETSHDEPGYHHHLRDQGHVNPVAPQSPATTTSAPAPPRPPSARSSYSNYHPARLPVNSPNGVNPNVFNLNQTLFTNPAYDSSVDYNNSMLSHHTNMGYYDDEQFHPAMAMAQFHNSSNHIPPVPMPRPFNTVVTSNNLILHSSPPPLARNFADLMFQQQKNARRTDNNHHTPLNNPTLVYPLAHSPVSQESFPMWGIAQAQVPTQSPGVQSSSSGYPPLTPIINRSYTNNPPIPFRQQQKLQPAQRSSEINSETVI